MALPAPLGELIGSVVFSTGCSMLPPMLGFGGESVTVDLRQQLGTNVTLQSPEKFTGIYLYYPNPKSKGKRVFASRN